MSDNIKHIFDKQLLELDMKWARSQCPDNFDDEALLLGMHKIRYDKITLPDEARLISGEWLRERGYRRMMGNDLLPPGELPE